MSTKQEHAVALRIDYSETAVYERRADGTDGDLFADCINAPDPQANAALIVRAVNAHAELVAALESLLTACDACGSDFAAWNLQAPIEQARTALRKAGA